MENIKAFLMKDTAGIPNWGWAIVIVAGVGLALVSRRFFSGGTTSDTSTDSGTAGLGGYTPVGAGAGDGGSGAGVGTAPQPDNGGNTGGAPFPPITVDPTAFDPGSGDATTSASPSPKSPTPGEPANYGNAPHTQPSHSSSSQSAAAYTPQWNPAYALNTMYQRAGQPAYLTPSGHYVHAGSNTPNARVIAVHEARRDRRMPDE